MLTTSQLNAVNRAVNKKPYKTDMRRYGEVDFWTTIDSRGGDCEDYALEKRRLLITLGIDPTKLRLCICRDAYGQGHCVLTVDTPAGTLVLDNNSDTILSWDKAPYTWIMRQAPTGKGWVEVA